MPYTLDLKDNQIDLVIEKYEEFEIPSTNDYTLFRGKIKNNNLTIYTTGKLLIQGKNPEELFHEICVLLKIPHEMTNTNTDSNEEKYVPNYGDDTIGSDEVGTGDFFGGIIVCSCLVKGNDILLVRRLGVKDSKQLIDERIKEIAKELMKHLSYQISLLSPTKYNTITTAKDYNMNSIKAVMHNSAILKLIDKTSCHHVVLDQFCSPENYFDYLKNQEKVCREIIFEEKAENKYLAVACASIIARYFFLEYLDKLSMESGYELLKGASARVDELAAIIIQEKGIKTLGTLAKLNFKNYEKAKAIVKNNKK